MSTYFVFSDETGQYAYNANESFCHRHPLYVRSAVIFSVKAWKNLKEEYLQIKKKYELPDDKEVKWSYLWSLFKRQKNGEQISPNEPYYFLKDFPLPRFRAYMSDVFQSIQSCDYCKVILTVTFNKPSNMCTQRFLYKMHLQEIMQRVEMEVRSDKDNLAILFFDQTNPEIDNLFRDAYHKIYSKGDFIRKYHHTKDCISIEGSHHSFGIVLADYAAGCFAGFLRGYPFCEGLFQRHLCKILRKSSSGKLLGFGIREVPSDSTNRGKIASRLNILLAVVDKF